MFVRRAYMAYATTQAWPAEYLRASDSRGLGLMSGHRGTWYVALDPLCPSNSYFVFWWTMNVDQTLSKPIYKDRFSNILPNIFGLKRNAVIFFQVLIKFYAVPFLS